MLPGVMCVARCHVCCQVSEDEFIELVYNVMAQLPEPSQQKGVRAMRAAARRLPTKMVGHCKARCSSGHSAGCSSGHSAGCSSGHSAGCSTRHNTGHTGHSAVEEFAPQPLTYRPNGFGIGTKLSLLRFEVGFPFKSFFTFESLTRLCGCGSI